MNYPEDLHSAWCKVLLTALNFEWWSTEQGYRKEPGGTRTTPGYTDLLGGNRKWRCWFFFEVKPPREARAARRLLERPGHDLTPGQLRTYRRAVAQARFGALVADLDLPGLLYGYGGLPELAVMLSAAVPVPRIVGAVRIVDCPRDIHDDTFAALQAATAGRTPALDGEGPGA